MNAINKMCCFRYLFSIFFFFHFYRFVSYKQFSLQALTSYYVCVRGKMDELLFFFESRVLFWNNLPTAME